MYDISRNRKHLIMMKEYYSMKKRYEIELRGCDDSTFFQIGLTDKEHTLLKRISDKSKQLSKYDCMPQLFITPSYVALSTPQISK